MTLNRLQVYPVHKTPPKKPSIRPSYIELKNQNFCVFFFFWKKFYWWCLQTPIELKNHIFLCVFFFEKNFIGGVYKQKNRIKKNKNNVFIGTNLTTGVCKHHQNLFFALKIKIKKKTSKKPSIRPSCIESQILGFWLGLMDGIYLYRFFKIVCLFVKIEKLFLNVK